MANLLYIPLGAVVVTIPIVVLLAVLDLANGEMTSETADIYIGLLGVGVAALAVGWIVTRALKRPAGRDVS